MNRITTISAARSTGLLVVALESGERHLLSAGRLADLRLAPGDQLDAAARERLTDAAADERTEQRLLRLVATRPRSRAELMRRLALWHVPEARAETLLARLERAGLLDDGKLAVELSESLRRRGQGSLRAAHELSRLGVERELAHPAVADHAAADASLARQLLERRFGPPPYDRPTARRAAALLARRGFHDEAVAELLDLEVG